ncbi:MAG: hypothetical protein WA231_06300 [Methylocella sp.]
MNATTIAFDIAKGVIQLHGVDASFAVTPRKRLSRTGAREFFASLPPCLVGMEACGSPPQRRHRPKRVPEGESPPGAGKCAGDDDGPVARRGKANPAKRMAGPSAFA